MDIGKELKKYRIEKNLTQRQLSEKCGIAESTLRQYELGIRKPKPATVGKIARALELPQIDYFVTSEDSSFIIEIKTSGNTDFEKRILSYMRKLNFDGKIELENVISELINNPKYTITEKKD